MKKTSKKKFEKLLKCMFVLFALLSEMEWGFVHASCPNASIAGQVVLQATLIGVNPTHSNGERPRGPIQPPYVYLDGHTLDMSCVGFDTTLQLLDEDGDVVYTAFIPAGTSSVILPTTLSGDFEIRFETDTYYYYGYISL